MSYSTRREQLNLKLERVPSNPVYKLITELVYYSDKQYPE